MKRSWIIPIALLLVATILWISLRPLQFHPVKDKDGILEVGYWRGEGNGIGGHIWIRLTPFRLGKHRFSDTEFNLNRFKIHLPCDLNELNDKTIDCGSDEFSFGPGGRLSLQSDEGEEFLLTPEVIHFKRTGNQAFKMTMSGRLSSHGFDRSFRVRSNLALQFGYGAREPHPNEATIDTAIQLAGVGGLPRWCDETYESSWDFDQVSQTFLLLRLHRNEDLRLWQESLSPLNDISNAALPQFEIPEWWLTAKLDTEVGEAKKTKVFFNEKSFKEDEEGNRVGFGLSVESPAMPKQPNRIVFGNLRELLENPDTAMFYSLASSKKTAGWIALQADTQCGGNIFVFSTTENMAETEKSTP